MRVFLHIPAWNEEANLGNTLRLLPKSLPDYPDITLQVAVTDDGSTDRTSTIAAAEGALVNRLKRHRGLAHGWVSGMAFCLQHGADIVVNLDADNQYAISDLPKLLAPILRHEADMVIGCRPHATIEHFSPIKRFIQIQGSRFLSWLCDNDIADATSGYRAMTREALVQLQVHSKYTYTLETLIHAERLGLAIVSVPVGVNPPTRESKLVRSSFSYCRKAAWTIFRILSLYRPYVLFIPLSGVFAIPGLILGLRFLISFFLYHDDGKIQSLILTAILLLTGFGCLMLGVLAEQLVINRVLTEKVLAAQRLRNLGPNNNVV